MPAVLLAGVIWTFWIGVIFFITVVVAIVALIVGYLVKVVAFRYPPGEIQRRIQALIQRRS